jgi:hypothetical protein
MKKWQNLETANGLLKSTSKKMKDRKSREERFSLHFQQHLMCTTLKTVFSRQLLKSKKYLGLLKTLLFLSENLMKLSSTISSNKENSRSIKL